MRVGSRALARGNLDIFLNPWVRLFFLSLSLTKGRGCAQKSNLLGLPILSTVFGSFNRNTGRLLLVYCKCLHISIHTLFSPFFILRFLYLAHKTAVHFEAKKGISLGGANVVLGAVSMHLGPVGEVLQGARHEPESSSGATYKFYVQYQLLFCIRVFVLGWCAWWPIWYCIRSTRKRLCSG